MVRQWIGAALCALGLLVGTQSAVVVAAADPAPDATLEAAPDAAPDAAVDAASLDVPTLLHNAAVWYGLDEARFRRIAWCESRFNPYAVSRGGHKGVFQFADATWRWASASAGYGGMSPFNAQANIYSAAWLMSQPGGYRHWSCR